MLTLEDFRKRAGLNPWHFWQLSDGQVAPVTASCSTLVVEYAWQSVTRSSRADLREAVSRAALKLREFLGYPVQREQCFERIAFPNPQAFRQQYERSQDARGKWLGLRAAEGWVRRVGQWQTTIVATPAITLIDTNGDGVNDAAQISATFPHAAGEAALYLPSSEWRDGAIGEAWRVQPDWLRVNAGVLQAQIPLWLLVKRALYETSTGAQIALTNAANFVSTLTVARRWVDASAQGFFAWETQANDCVGSDDPAGVTRQTARFTVRSEANGWIAGESADYDATAQTWRASGWALYRQPDFAEINYIAGRDDDEIINEAHYLLTCAEMDDGVCGCATANREILKWQEDLSLSNEARTFNTSFAALDCPFGTRRGQIQAWQLVKDLRRIKAAVIV